MTNTIRHQGVVENIMGTHVRVRIVQTSACATCSIKGHCTSADTKEKLIDVVDADAASYQCGESVWVIGELSMGMKAVLLAFILPLLLLVVAMFVWMEVLADELYASLCTLAILVPYYYVLWLNRERLKKQFSFSIHHVN